MTHMKQLQLFSKAQFGFISGRSTVLLLDQWTEALDKGEAVDVVYCDFMKAFDRVPHQRLLSKLAAYGIDDQYITWIKAFLTERRQRSVVNEMSGWK